MTRRTNGAPRSQDARKHRAPPRLEGPHGPEAEAATPPEQAVPAESRAALARWQAETRAGIWSRDPVLAAVLALDAPELAARHRAELEAFGARVSTDLADWAEVTNRDEFLPRLERFDGLGEPREEVRFHPDYHRMGEVIYGARIMADYAAPGRELLQMMKFLMVGSLGEAGHLCPLACTAGMIKILQQKGAAELQARYLPRLLDPAYGHGGVGAQFVTEIQGGSDVGATAVVARPDPDRPGVWRLTGEKWFCSVIHADLFLLAARVDGAAAGTRGVGCFLVPRRRPDGSLNRFTIRRLKRKLGTRSMPSAEVDWNGAEGYAVGPTEDGFKNLIGIVLHTSRIVNAIGCAGSMLRATLDAEAYARHRIAFGRPIATYPAVRRTLARMKAKTWAGIASSFWLVAMGERNAQAGEEGPERMAWRTLTNANKLGTALDNTQVVRDGIEVLGGNGTIEEFSVLPRLFRDAMVFESWEGAHNVLAAQVLRDAVRYRADEAALHLLETQLRELETPVRSRAKAPARAAWRDQVPRVRARLAMAADAYRTIKRAAPEDAEDQARGALDALQAAFQATALLRLAAHPGAPATAAACLAHFLDLLPAPAPAPSRAGVDAVLAAS